MSSTANLLGLPHRKNSPWTQRLSIVADRLVAEYGVPTLGNFRDPIKEIFYILLSAKTTDAQYRITHRNLGKAFPKLADLSNAPVPEIRKCILSGRLAGKRVRQIRRTARALVAAGGTNPSRFLKALPLKEAFAFLRGLPGMGPKSAFCVLMYSLEADALPVDMNVQRIAERRGQSLPA